MLYEKRYIAYPAIFHCLEKGNWPLLRPAIEKVGRLTPQSVLDNEAYMGVVAEIGGFGDDYRRREEWLEKDVEWTWFTRKLIDEDLACVLKTLTNPVDGVTLEPSYNDQLVTVEHRFYDQYGRTEHDQGHPYWPWRRLLALRVLGGQLHEPRHWLDLLPPERRDRACRQIAEAMNGGRMDGDLTVELWRAEAAFHATPDHRRQFGLDPEDLVRLADAVETSRDFDFRCALDALGPWPIALVAREHCEGPRESLLSRFDDRDRATIEEAIADERLERRLDDERHEAFDVGDAHVRLRAALTYWAANARLRS